MTLLAFLFSPRGFAMASFARKSLSRGILTQSRENHATAGALANYSCWFGSYPCMAHGQVRGRRPQTHVHQRSGWMAGVVVGVLGVGVGVGVGVVVSSVMPIVKVADPV